MDEALTRKEKREQGDQKLESFNKNMKKALSILSKSNEGVLVLRFLMYESSFLAPLTYETPEGINKDVLIGKEAKRRMYLSLRGYMDRETITRIELPVEETKPKEGTNG